MRDFEIPHPHLKEKKGERKEREKGKKGGRKEKKPDTKETSYFFLLERRLFL